MKDKTLFFHGTSVDGRRFTIAARFIKDRRDNDDLILGIAICSNTDQFVKKVGRNKAEGRLISEGFKGCTISSLYSNRFFSKYKVGEAGFPENWFAERELEIFIELCHEFENLTFKELKEEFNLLS
jgi:hypothetical protein